MKLIRPALLALGLATAVVPASEALTRTPLRLAAAGLEAPLLTQGEAEIVEDADIREQIVSTLAARHIPLVMVTVSVRNGVVTLQGSVRNADQKAAAERAAQQVEGVKQVNNELRVVLPGTGRR